VVDDLSLMEPIAALRRDLHMRTELGTPVADGADARVVGDLSGLTAGFADFYRREADAVHRAVRATIGDRAIAAEAVDEAMVRAYANWSKVGHYQVPAGWVYRTAVNWSISRWRKTRRERPMTAVPQRVDEGGVDPDGVAALMSLRTLPLEQRTVVVCRVLLDLDTRSTAVALDLPEGTVKSRLARALETLRSQMEDHS
jgi:DNA-directed RNA polymerase specialized sigma24 family protein